MAIITKPQQQNNDNHNFSISREVQARMVSPSKLLVLMFLGALAVGTVTSRVLLSENASPIQQEDFFDGSGYGSGIIGGGGGGIIGGGIVGGIGGVYGGEGGYEGGGVGEGIGGGIGGTPNFKVHTLGFIVFKDIPQINSTPYPPPAPPASPPPPPSAVTSSAPASNSFTQTTPVACSTTKPSPDPYPPPNPLLKFNNYFEDSLDY